MTTQHTPGPWQYSFEGATTAFIVESDGSTVVCMRVTANTSAHSGFAANARLIAQAPAMLRALQRLTHPAADDEDLRDALDVIARATGQPVADDDEGPEPPYAGYESEAQLQRMAEVRRLEALRAKGLIP